MKLTWWEKETLINALEKHNGNKSKVARYLDKSVRTIRLWCKEISHTDSTDSIKETPGGKTELRLFPTNKERIDYLNNPTSYYREKTRVEANG